MRGARIKTLRINREIGAHEVLLIDDQNKQLGIKSLFEALKLAEERNLDLVEVGPGARPPVVKVMDFGKYQYELEKKQKQQSKSADVKEVRLSVNIDSHDWQIKVNRAKKFLDQTGKVKAHIQLTGREMLFVDKAKEKLEQFKNDIGADYETPPQRFGRRIIATLKKVKNEKSQE